MNCGEQMNQKEDWVLLFLRKKWKGKLKIVETTEQRSSTMAMHFVIIIKTMCANCEWVQIRRTITAFCAVMKCSTDEHFNIIS